jgi:hypothetical protein
VVSTTHPYGSILGFLDRNYTLLIYKILVTCYEVWILNRIEPSHKEPCSKATSSTTNDIRNHLESKPSVRGLKPEPKHRSYGAACST